ncbi:MAG TPA: hypothetical protein PLZ93_07150, partial [Nocardioides sp.]|nr:hypothetical protein [Nocardioides sp.]
RIFAIVDRTDQGRQTLDQAGQVLRGGAYTASLAAGSPEGVAVVVALKSVGRFPDLRADDGNGAATERFIIGTLASVLWAAACAGMVLLVRL